MDARVYHSISYGLYVLGVKGENGAMGGCVVNTLFQITATPPVFAVSVNKENQTCSLIQKEGLFTASALAQDCDPGIIGLFGFHSGRDVDKNQNGDLAFSPNGLPYLKNGSCAYLEFAVCGQQDLGTHLLFFARLINGEVLSGSTPLTYAYYQTVLKGKSPKLAPTYRPDATIPVPAKQSAPEAPKAEAAQESGKKQYVCTICGYVYDGEIPFEELPEDWTCPICGVPKSMFEVK